MKTIFSTARLKGRQIALLSVLVLFAAVAEMMLPSLLAQMINNGVTESSKSKIFVLAAVMAGVTATACIVNFLSVRIASGSQQTFLPDSALRFLKRYKVFLPPRSTVSALPA